MMPVDCCGLTALYIDSLLLKQAVLAGCTNIINASEVSLVSRDVQGILLYIRLQLLGYERSADPHQGDRKGTPWFGALGACLAGALRKPGCNCNHRICFT